MSRSRSALLPDISWAGWWSGTRNLGPLEQICARVDYVNSLQENPEGRQAASEEVRSEFKALVEQCRGYGQKKRAPKRRAWNKGLEVGKRDGFTQAQVKRIRGLLADRGVPGLRDLALFSTAIDTMLHGQDLLHLVVGDVQRRDGSIRPVIEVTRARGTPPVRCALSNASTKALEKWITASGKKRTDYLFPGRGVEGRHPMDQRQLSRLLKLWVVEAGLDPSDYSMEFLRRTKALHILKRHWRFADSSSAVGPCKN